MEFIEIQTALGDFLENEAGGRFSSLSRRGHSMTQDRNILAMRRRDLTFCHQRLVSGACDVLNTLEQLEILKRISHFSSYRSHIDDDLKGALSGAEKRLSWVKKYRPTETEVIGLLTDAHSKIHEASDGWRRADQIVFERPELH